MGSAHGASKPLSPSDGNSENMVAIGPKESMNKTSQLRDSERRRGNVEELLIVVAQSAFIPKGSETMINSRPSGPEEFD